ncbi:LytTR family DNA-binding domain-containing protein [Aureisphaera galaxeae]|uniref:LytR/AlgR family response regulator transcription factor n=1 Tax=Aureisphaera galaxeae TaxID=1538023 RepID=UPI002350B351|nr:LytTR family DNA-binding domain-containing protein [Aureisphaera galaxeae]MDC8002915.1 LytTR family DNA-binding domain-containing protein [Aureisphaera galaxeae]
MTRFHNISKQKIIILMLVLINMAVGRIFHESLNLVCFSELFIVAGVGYLFWNAALPYIKKVVQKSGNNPKDLLIHSGLAISSSLLSVLASQGIILFAMAYIYNCTSPSFSFINASLTNNIALNFLCYAFLAYTLAEDYKRAKEKQRFEEVPETIPTEFNQKISLSSRNQKKLVAVTDICFIEASNNCIIIHTTVGKYVKYQSLKSFLEEHNHPNLKRVHRSYVVNTDFISSIEKNRSGDGVLNLTTDQTVKFSRNYKEELAC